MMLHRASADAGFAFRTQNEDLLDDFDYEAARNDGWTLSDCGFYSDGARRVELQKHDDPPSGAPSFREDRNAWLHVVVQARGGSPLHCRALDLIDCRERLAIEPVCGLW